MRALRRWVGGVAVVASLLLGSQVARGENTLQSTKQIQADVSLGQVRFSSSRVYGDRKGIYADLTLKFQCMSDYSVTHMHLDTRFDGRKTQRPKTPGRTEGGVVFKKVKVMTADEAENACGTRGFGMRSVVLRTEVDCYKHSVLNTFKKWKSRGNPVEITVGVKCNQNLVRPTSRPVKWHHNCPKGYWLEGKKGVPGGLSNRPTGVCVRAGVNYSRG